ncbi:MAG: hypothetical protein ABI921_02575 [Panacibacter sp.]
MKKIFVLSVLLFFCAQSYACPICGCGVGNFYMGLLPNFQSKFIGVRYQYLHYHTQLTDEPEEFSNDYYKTVELWGGFSIGKQWQLLAYVPYQLNTLHSDEGTKKLNGLGDISLIANYKLLDKTNTSSNGKSTVQQLWIGGGLKLPAGKYRIDIYNPETEIGDVNSQQGTGSTDFLLNATYDIRFNKFGINTTANYKINTTNNEQYHFGNRFNAASLAYYQVNLKNIVVTPNAGFMYQHSAENDFSNAKVEQTGGYLALSVIGAEISIKRIAIGANVQLPISQDFASGQTESKTRGMVHVSFSF